ncbi:tetratricopeptide repeat protein, partial [Micrococcus luteus]|nr:tetratricopeptide repeat protein [Micrococcus luteus]
LQNALRWYKNAASLGFVEAQYHLATLYFEGLKLPRDDAAALTLYAEAAAQDHAGANYRLGQMYQQGLGTVVDAATAQGYFLKACELGEQAACALVKTTK